MSEGGWLCGAGSHDVPGTLLSPFVLVLFTEKKKRDQMKIWQRLRVQ